LVIVLAILGVLFALTASAVATGRERALRLQCQANLHNLGLALWNYQTIAGAFPPALSSKAPPRYLSWMARLLPYAEQDPLWREALGAVRANPWPWANPPHPTDRVVQLFTCPDDPRTTAPVVPADIRVEPGPGGGTDVRLPVALTSYLGVSGTDLRSRDGILFPDSRVRPTDVRDGLSHTLLVGERPASADLAYGWWYAAPGQALSGSADIVLGVREQNIVRPGECPPGPYTFGPGRLDGPCDMFHFWSLHPGGANFLMADGSVRFLTYSAAGTLPALASRAGGEIVAGE
jgi:prepilin-type processing-associated H-X9-DG protein